ncbi:hypothetical protein GOC91_30915 [Sinorhizobium medicae]|uniref:Uncharacterized protein n=1 Tax=Ensifer canadensis TaxID=555315 RepID=A0AAW4FXG7_9HYPH|nr:MULTISPECIES: hypothetical protein [Sinorhizobium/Ensifer group]MBM3096130.1 hypothetical protein [Ensifer canadensis]MBO1945101.1 hypothetical protein [Sinorhizobium medicae]MDX0415182.1 hypothetical protein [Sinorhizobium medicae]MDX0421085.1 hypothetical protein [Sinorhizobium medicae]MDX0427161.1 hypothetical protein [Sinorhizobium medicae]
MLVVLAALPACTGISVNGSQQASRSLQGAVCPRAVSAAKPGSPLCNIKAELRRKATISRGKEARLNPKTAGAVTLKDTITSLHDMRRG